MGEGEGEGEGEREGDGEGQRERKGGRGWDGAMQRNEWISFSAV